MYEFINKLRLTRQLTFEEGQINLLGKPTVMMLPADAFIELHNIYLKEDPVKLYEIGKAAGCDFHGLVAHYALDPQHVIKFGVQVFNISGFGRLEVEQIDYDNARCIMHIKNSIFVKTKSDEPVCHYIRGMLAGFMQKSLCKDIEAVEKACMAQGHQMCEFVLQKMAEFDKTSELVKRQLRV